MSFTKSFFFLFVFFISLGFGRFQNDTSFTMLQSNQITGMIPNVSDAYGVVFRDLNDDTHPDLYFTCFRSLNRLLINNGGIIPFVDRTIYSGTGGFLMVTGNKNLELGASTADFDNDGLPDLFLAGWGKASKLFRNTGGVSFEDVTENLNLQGTIDANQGLWFDADNDGYLDLYISDQHYSNRLFKNLQNGYFQETLWIDTFIDNAVSQSASNCDIDLDGDQDLYVSNWFYPDYLLINNGDGSFNKKELVLTTLTDSVSTNSSSFADLDNDGDPDLLVAGNNGYVYYYQNISDSSGIKFTEITSHPFYHLKNRIFGTLIEDFNLDGWLDCFITTNGENRLYLNDGQGSFLNNFDSDFKQTYSTGSSAADIDRDGDLDIVVSNKFENSQIYLNPSNTKKYLKLKFLGVESNRDAVGTKVFFYSLQDTIKTFLGYREVGVSASYLSSKPPEIVFGTQDQEKIIVEAIFSSGVKQVKEYTDFGKSSRFREHGGLLRAWFSLVKNVKFLTSRKDFWVNTLLILFIIFFIIGYLSLGLKRYNWSAFNISIQLSIWFLLSLFLFIIFKTSSTSIILITILSLALFGIVLLTLYSENFLRQRRKRDSIRELLQGLSDRIINIHDNDSLLQEIEKAFLKHPAINSVQTHFLNGEMCFKKNIQLSSDDVGLLIRKNILSREQVSFAKKIDLSINLVLPIKRKETVFGLILIDMKDSKSSINQEDVERFVSIANQSAIAVENNNYIKDTAQLIEQLTSAKVKEQYVKELEKTNSELDEKNKELNRLFNELQSKESQLIHSEKMASLGQLVAGISHELNNPISFIYTNMNILTEYIDDLSTQIKGVSNNEVENKINKILDELKSIIADSSNGSKTIKEIVQNLKNFSRLDEAKWKESKISEILGSCLKMVKAQISREVKIELNIKDDPLFYCNPGQLNQVFLNLLTNAYQAIEKAGIIKIESHIAEGFLVTKIIDNGPGIPPEIIKKIFDPFFTTKPVNKGTGLGLSISYSIIEKHQGQLSVKSKPGHGTTFTIKIPLNLEVL